MNYLQVINLDKIEAHRYFELQINGNGDWLPNIKDASTEWFQLQTSVLYQPICISKAGLVSLRHVLAKYKDRVPDVSDSNQNIGELCNTKLKLPESKDLCIKSTEKLVKDEWM